MIGNPLTQRVEPLFAFCFGKIAEDKRRYGILAAGMANADANAPEIRPQMGRRRFKTVVPCEPATLLDADLSRGKVDLIVKDDDLVWLDFMESRGSGDGIAAFIVERLRAKREHTRAADPTIGQRATEFRPLGPKAMGLNDRTNDLEACIVAVLGVFCTRIAETDE